MQIKQVYIDLSNRITSDNHELVSSFLARHSDLDMTYSNGKLLRLAIESNGSVLVTIILIDYFETVQLAKLAKGSTEYNILKYRFKTALRTATEGERLSNEMQSLLSKHIDFNSDNEQDLEGFENVVHSSSDNDDSDRSEFGSQGSSTYPAITTHRTNEADEVEKNDTITSSIVTVGNDAHEIVVLLGSSD